MNQNDDKKKKLAQKVNPLEAIRDMGRTTGNVVGEELIKPMSQDFMRQIFGQGEQKFSSEFSPGESVEMKDVFSGNKDQGKSIEVKNQLLFERRLFDEEKIFVEKRTNELRIQIQAIHEEILKLAKITPELSQEIEIAAIQAPGDPSSFELSFLEHIFNFIKSFREKIEKAAVWMRACNHRAKKKNAWGANYKKHGAKYLLSGEHYLQRSAG
jgi:hypothetical protein